MKTFSFQLHFRPWGMLILSGVLFCSSCSKPEFESTNEDAANLKPQVSSPIPDSEKGFAENALNHFETAKEKLSNFETEPIMKEVERYYELAKEKGEQVPKDVKQWLSENIENLTTWEYHITSWPSRTPPKELQSELNKLGIERWEFIDSFESNGNIQFVFKRRKSSYLRHIPYRDLIRLFPNGSSQE